MRKIMKHSTSAVSLAVMLLVSGTAFAYEATAFERAELAQLTPQVRSQVESRMTGGQTVRGILDTMFLNNISQLFDANRVISIDFDKGVAVVGARTVRSRFSISTLPRW